MFSYRWTSWPAFNFIARLKKQERKKWLTFWYSIYIHLEGLIYIHIIVFEQTLNMYFNVCSITILNLHHLCIYLGSGMGMYQQFQLLVEKWKKTFLLFLPSISYDFSKTTTNFIFLAAYPISGNHSIHHYKYLQAAAIF